MEQQLCGCNTALGIIGRRVGGQTYFSLLFIEGKVYLKLHHHMTKKEFYPKMKIFFTLRANSPFFKNIGRSVRSTTASVLQIPTTTTTPIIPNSREMREVL